MAYSSSNNNYKGELLLPCDGPGNMGALSQLVNLVASTVDYSKCRSERERRLLKANSNLALAKIHRQFTPRMTFENFEIKYLVGFGSYGRIWMSTSDFTGDVAIKQMPATLETCSNIWKERDIMITLKHPRICNLLGAFYYSDAFLVMDLCYGSVAALRKKITPKNTVRFAMQLLEAVKWMHLKNIVHADLKPDNCLIKTDNTLVVSDFGSAIILKNDKSEVMLHDSHGSPGYQDYQALKYLRFSKQTDIFSSACIIFEMDLKATLLFYHSRPFHPRSIYIDAFENGRIIGLMPYQDPTPEMKRERIGDRALASRFGWLLQKMIRVTDRITAAQAIEDSSFRTIITESEVSLTAPSRRADYVTREFNYDTSKQFALMSQRPAPFTDTCFLTFYYDQDETNALVDPITDEYQDKESSQSDDDQNDQNNETLIKRPSKLLLPIRRVRQEQNLMEKDEQVGIRFCDTPTRINAAVVMNQQPFDSASLPLVPRKIKKEDAKFEQDSQYMFPPSDDDENDEHDDEKDENDDEKDESDDEKDENDDEKDDDNDDINDDLNENEKTSDANVQPLYDDLAPTPCTTGSKLHDNNRRRLSPTPLVSSTSTTNKRPYHQDLSPVMPIASKRHQINPPLILSPIPVPIVSSSKPFRVYHPDLSPLPVATKPYRVYHPDLSPLPVASKPYIVLHPDLSPTPVASKPHKVNHPDLTPLPLDRVDHV